MSTTKAPLFRLHELAFGTQYAELKERVRSTERLLPGTPGTLVKRSGTGRSYWYRAYQGAAGKQVEDIVCRDTDEAGYAQARDEIEFAQWVGTQVRTLRKLEFQVTARTQDIDLAARQDLKLAAPKSFMEVVERTKMGFCLVPGLSPKDPATSVKLPGNQGLRVAVLTHGAHTGQPVAIAPLQWHAQTIAHYDFVLEDTREAALLAGTHCIPVQLPAPERFVWHKLYSSAVRKTFPEKAVKDLRQGVTLAAVLAEHDDAALPDAAAQLPQAMRQVLVKRRAAILSALDQHPAARQAIERALVGS